MSTELTPEQLKKGNRIIYGFMAFCGLIVLITWILTGGLKKKPNACKCASIMSFYESQGFIKNSQVELKDDCYDAYGKSYNARLKCN